MNDPLSRDVARRRGEKVPTLSLANPTLEDVRPLIAEVNKLRNRVTGLNGLPASLKPEAKRCARLLDDAASVLVDIFKAAGEAK